jgi:glycosyltransferase involved in cell wall biosynthesis
VTRSTTPHILHVAQPSEGGVARYVAAAARDQVARGWRVTVAAPDREPLASMLAGTGAARVVWEAGRSPGPRTVREVVALTRVVADVCPDLVHLHSAKAGLAGRLALRGRVPTIFQPHGWSWLAVRGLTALLSLSWERRAVRWADLCVCVGDGEAEVARDAGIGEPLVVVRNGVDLGRYRSSGRRERTAARTVLDVPEEVPLVVCPGRLTRQKGQDVLVAAWPSILDQLPAARLVLVGDGEAMPVTPGGAIRMAGAVDDVRPWLAAADVVVFPSRWEGLSLGLLEAMAMGRSVVVSDIPGLREVVDQDSGARVPPSDEAALARALVDRLADPALAAAEGRAAARRAGERHGNTVTFDRLAALTLGIIGQPRHRRRSAAAEHLA